MRSELSSKLSISGMGLGFGVGALVLVVMMWLGGEVFHSVGNMGPSMIMGNGAGSWGFGAAIVFVICSAIVGTVVAFIHNSVAK